MKLPVAFICLGAVFLAGGMFAMPMTQTPIWSRSLATSPAAVELAGDMRHLLNMREQLKLQREKFQMGVVMKLISDSPEVAEDLVNSLINELNSMQLEDVVVIDDE